MAKKKKDRVKTELKDLMKAMQEKDSTDVVPQLKKEDDIEEQDTESLIKEIDPNGKSEGLKTIPSFLHAVEDTENEDVAAEEQTNEDDAKKSTDVNSDLDQEITTQETQIENSDTQQSPPPMTPPPAPSQPSSPPPMAPPTTPSQPPSPPPMAPPTAPGQPPNPPTVEEVVPQEPIEPENPYAPTGSLWGDTSVFFTELIDSYGERYDIWEESLNQILGILRKIQMINQENTEVLIASITKVHEKLEKGLERFKTKRDYIEKISDTDYQHVTKMLKKTLDLLSLQLKEIKLKNLLDQVYSVYSKK